MKYEVLGGLLEEQEVMAGPRGASSGRRGSELAGMATIAATSGCSRLRVGRLLRWRRGGAAGMGGPTLAHPPPARLPKRCWRRSQALVGHDH